MVLLADEMKQQEPKELSNKLDVSSHQSGSDLKVGGLKESGAKILMIVFRNPYITDFLND